MALSRDELLIALEAARNGVSPVKTVREARAASKPTGNEEVFEDVAFACGLTVRDYVDKWVNPRIGSKRIAELLEIAART